METAGLSPSTPSSGRRDFTPASDGSPSDPQQLVGPQEAYVARQQYWDELEDSAMSIENTESIIQKLMKTEEGRVKRTFVGGRPTADVIEDAPVLKVGLSFLAGSHEAKITKAEQIDMMKETRKPEQMSAEWRVRTAGTLLRDFNVREDLTVVSKDRSAQAADSAKNRPRSRFLLSGAFKARSESKLESMARVRSKEFDAVTIDSDLVTIVHDIHTCPGEFDLECALIEVDGPSLGNLIVRYRKLIEGRGPAMNVDQTRDLLEIMMEDVRRLCHRSPILFRMSTRSRIIKSKFT